MTPVKLFKLVDDPCFGVKHQRIDQCTCCWINKACATRFRNNKHV